LRDTIEPTRDYLDEMIAWFAHSHGAWMASLAAANEAEIDRPHALHWGATAPYAIVVMLAHHHVYHTGEITLLLSLQRGEAWEEREEVEENHISTVGSRVRPPWRERP
jgi:DinB superfamily